MICSLSNLTDEDLAQIRSLESELDSPLLAFSCHGIRPAVLDDEKLQKIEALENRLGISLLAVDA